MNKSYKRLGHCMSLKKNITPVAFQPIMAATKKQVTQEEQTMSYDHFCSAGCSKLRTTPEPDGKTKR